MDERELRLRSEIRGMAERKLELDRQMMDLKRESMELERAVIERLIEKGHYHLLQVRWKRVASPRYW